MCTLLLVPVLVCVISHAGGRGINWWLIGTLPPAGRIHHCITLHVAAAAARVVAAVVVVVVVVVAVTVAVVVFPHSWGRRRVAGHGIAGVWTVFKRNVPEWKLSVLVELLKLGATVLEPNFDLKERASDVEAECRN